MPNPGWPAAHRRTSARLARRRASRHFYEAGGDRDPIRGPAAAHQRLAGTLLMHAWAAFEVLAARPAVR